MATSETNVTKKETVEYEKDFTPKIENRKIRKPMVIAVAIVILLAGLGIVGYFIYDGSFYYLSFELTVIHSGVKSACRKQFRVISLFYNVPVIQHEDEIGIFNRRQPVRDNKTRPAFHQRIHCFLYQYFCAGVN